MTRKIAIAAILLLGTMSFANAQDRGAGGGASQLSPGHEMKSGRDADDRGPGASGFSPGHEMKEHGTVGESRRDRDRDMDRDRDHVRRDTDRDHDRGASEFSPGDRMHDRNSMDRR